MMQCVAVCYSVLQCEAVWCRVFPYVAVCFSVLQCVAVWCNVVQRLDVHPNLAGQIASKSS